jgi:hypothetical protein
MYENQHTYSICVPHTMDYMNFMLIWHHMKYFQKNSDVMWCDVMWCDVMWCDVMLCDVMWCDVVWCDVMWCDVVWCDVMWCDVMWCDVMWCDVMWCDVMWHIRKQKHLCPSMPNVNHSNTNSCTDATPFLDFVYCLILKNTFWKPAVLPSSGKEAPNLVDPLDQAMLSHWASQEHTFC